MPPVSKIKTKAKIAAQQSAKRRRCWREESCDELFLNLRYNGPGFVIYGKKASLRPGSTLHLERFAPSTIAELESFIGIDEHGTGQARHRFMAPLLPLLDALKRKILEKSVLSAEDRRLCAYVEQVVQQKLYGTHSTTSLSRRTARQLLKMIAVACETVCEFCKQLSEVVATTSENEPFIRDPVLLMSLPSRLGSEQAWHFDLGRTNYTIEQLRQDREYVDAFTNERNIPMLSVVVAMDKPVFLHVIPHSHRLIWGDCTTELRPKLVLLKPGQMLIFRQDLIHAGASYSDLNFRLHFYLDLGHSTLRSSNSFFFAAELLDETIFPLRSPADVLPEDIISK